MSSVVIIGAGLGGLFTGAILAKEGFSVTILEKNATIGGGLQTFKRFGETFDTGMHVIGGMRPGGNIRKICNYLGITDQVRLQDVDDDCTDRLYFSEDKQYYTLAKGKEGFVNSLAAYFPEEREHLEADLGVTRSVRVAEAQQEEEESAPERRRRSDRYRSGLRGAVLQFRTRLQAEEEEDEDEPEFLPPIMSKEEAFRAPVYPGGQRGRNAAQPGGEDR